MSQAMRGRRRSLKEMLTCYRCQKGVMMENWEESEDADVFFHFCTFWRSTFPVERSMCEECHEKKRKGEEEGREGSDATSPSCKNYTPTSMDAMIILCDWKSPPALDASFPVDSNR